MPNPNSCRFDSRSFTYNNFFIIQKYPGLSSGYYLFFNHEILTSFNDLHQRQKYNFKILFQTLIIYILHVISYLIRHNLLHVSPVRITCLSQDGIFIRILDRSIIRYTRNNRQHFTLLDSVHIHVLPYLRSRSHQTHLSPYHVQQLRQFVQFILSQEIPNPCYP